MFVPFVFTLEVASDYFHLLPFLKYVDMAKRHKWPIIAHERYFKVLASSLDEFGLSEEKLLSLQEEWSLEQHPYEGVEQIVAYPISAAFEESLISAFPSQLDAWTYLLTHEDIGFTALIGEILDSIVADNTERIEGILCFFVPESLRIAAAERKIRIFSNEISVIRPPFYKTLAGYIDDNVLSEGELAQRFARFTGELGCTKVPLLSRKGLLRLFAAEEYVRDIHQIDKAPRYELGILLLNSLHGLHYQYSLMSNEEMVAKALRKYRTDEILIRARPGFSSMSSTDDSPTSFHFSCKCKRVMGIQTNGLFEAMLVGRPAYGYNKHQFTFVENCGIGDCDTKLASIELLNFVLFAYIVPMAWITDPEYLRFRNSSPSEIEVYKKGFAYWTKDISDAELQMYYTSDGYEYRIGDTLYFDTGHAPHEYALYYCIEGFSEQEDGFVWSSGNNSAMVFDIIEPVSGDMTITFEIFVLSADATNERVQNVYCEVNGLLVDSCRLKADTTILNFTIPQSIILETKHLEIRLVYNFSASPSGDSRLLAIAYRSVSIAMIDKDQIRTLSNDPSFTSYAQNFEDAILWRVLGDLQKGFYIDIGASDPTVDSVSLAFYERGWRGVSVEPTLYYADLLSQERPDEIIEQVAISDKEGELDFYEFAKSRLSTLERAIAERYGREKLSFRTIKVSVITLDILFKKHYIKEPVAWLKLDVEGHEKSALSGWVESRVRPWVLVIKSTLPSSTVQVFADWEDLVLEKGYVFAYSDGLNRYYVHESKIELLAAFSNLAVDSTLKRGAPQPLTRYIMRSLEEAEAWGQREAARAQEAETRALQSEEKVNSMQNQLNAVIASRSWRFTKPLRGLGRMLRGDTLDK
jgi:FkbM family methyltransferase